MDANNDFPEGWKPSPGESIKGEVVDLDVRAGEYGKYPIVVLETDGGRVAVHAFHEVLQSELARRSPKPGDTVEIVYRGKHPERGYHLYQVSGDGDLAFSWNQFGGGVFVPDPDPASPGYANRGNPDEDDVPF
jgi:hypothetical protein